MDGEVTPRQRRELLAHVESCHDCAAWLARVRQTDVLLKGVPETHPSDRVRNAVLGTVRRSSPATLHRPGATPMSRGRFRLSAAGFLLRFDPSPQRIALAATVSLFAIIGMAYWMNVLPPFWWYDKLGFEFPSDSGRSVIGATPLPAIAAGSSSGAGSVAVPGAIRLVPEANSLEVAVDQPVSVRFDQPMDRATTEAALQIDPPTAGEFTWTADNEMRFSPHAPGLLRGTVYTVTLNGSARSLAGTPVKEPVSWSFRTREPYAITPDVASGATVAPTSTFAIHFSVPMDEANSRDRILLHSAGPKGNIPIALRWDNDGRAVTISPVAPLPEGRLYLRMGAMSPTQGGDTLGRTYEFSYDVALPTPRLRLLDGPVIVASSKITASLRYEAVDKASVPLPVVTFELYRLPAERLSALAPQNRVWPTGLPSGFMAGLASVRTLQAKANNLPTDSAVKLSGLPPDIYLLTANANSEAGALSDWQLVVVTDRRLATTNGGPLWATDEAGRAWAGGEVSLYSPAGTLLEKGMTNEAGLWTPSAKGSGASLALARDPQGHIAALTLNAPDAWGDAPASLNATLQTDLSVYHREQTVNFRALVHHSINAPPSTPIAEQDVAVALLTPDGATVSVLTLKPDNAGGVSGSFELSPDVQPGQYAIRVRLGDSQRDFPVQVEAAPTDTLGVYIAPDLSEAAGAPAITRTVSVLGPRGEPSEGALITATLRILGDSWASQPVTATTGSDGRATIVSPLPTWSADYNDPGLYLNVEAALGEKVGTTSTYLDFTLPHAALSGARQLVSPALDLAVVARPATDGSARLRLVELGLEQVKSEQVKGDVLVMAQSREGERLAWSLDLASIGDATLVVPQRFAGGSIYFRKADINTSRQVELTPARQNDPLLRVTTPYTATPGATLPVHLSLQDAEGQQLAGVASLWLRPVSGASNDESAQGWEPSINLPAEVTTTTLTMPSTPGLWYIMAEAATGDGDYARAWSVVTVLPGPAIQLPPAQQTEAGQPAQVSVVVHNPGGDAISSGVRAQGDNDAQITGQQAQDVNVEAGGWQRLLWNYTAQRAGHSALRFSFLPSAGIESHWLLNVDSSASSHVDTTYAAGRLDSEKMIKVQVPSGLSTGNVQLEVHASTSLLPALADIAASLNDTAASGQDEVAIAAARLSSSASVTSAYQRTGSQGPSYLALPGVKRSLVLQQLYAAQHEDGGWGGQFAGIEPSSMTQTAHVLLAARRQNLSLTDSLPMPQPSVDSSVINRGLAFLSWEVARPVGDEPTTAQLDEKAYGMYTLSVYGLLEPQLARSCMVYATPGANTNKSGLSRTGQAWLALALWQAGQTDDALALIDRLLATETGPQIEASAPMLEALVAVSSVARPGGSGRLGASDYQAAAHTYATALMELRQGAGWGTSSATADALWALSRYAIQQDEKLQQASPTVTLNDHAVQPAGQPDDPSVLSVVLSGGALHAGTNWLRLQPPSENQPLYYSLILRARR